MVILQTDSANLATGASSNPRYPKGLPLVDARLPFAAPSDSQMARSPTGRNLVLATARIEDIQIGELGSLATSTRILPAVQLTFLSDSNPHPPQVLLSRVQVTQFRTRHDQSGQFVDFTLHFAGITSAGGKG